MESFLLKGFEIYHFKPQQVDSNHVILFSHSNGISAGTYKKLLQSWADLWQVEIFAYDMRGMGRTKMHASAGQHRHAPQDPWQVLAQDLVFLYSELRKIHAKFRSHSLTIKTETRKDCEWSLAGHSLGGWISVLAARQLPVKNLLLLDVPLLERRTALAWGLACFVRQRQAHPLAKAARRRKILFRSHEEAAKAFQKHRFFKRWPAEQIKTFIDENYEKNQLGLHLRHQPEWEARLFESMFAVPEFTLLAMPKAWRERMKVTLIRGENSTVCDERAADVFRRFFPLTRWLQLQGGDHMFPFENEASLLRLLAHEKDTFLGPL